MPITPRQAEILDRAAELVAESGLGNLTMKRVAERVGFTEPAIYRHFPGKQALVRAMIERFSGRLLGTIGALAADRALAPQERLLGHGAPPRLPAAGEPRAADPAHRRGSRLGRQ